MKKKLIALFLALVMVMSLSVAVFAEGEGDGTTDPTDATTVTLTKVYKLTNEGTTSPAETFTFSTLTCTSVTDAADDVTKENAPVPTIASVSYEEGEAGGDNAKKEITITLPEYTSVGVYTYTFTENDGGTAGVTYRSDAITLVVTVIQGSDGKLRVATVHTEGESEAKSAEFDNVYSAGSLSVKKVVTGNLGDQTKEFTVKVTFNAPEGDTVKSDISYTDGEETKKIEAGENGWTGSKEVEITLKHDETVTFTNIPYGVTYTVTENDYSSDGYTASYAYDDETGKKIDTASENVTITNNKSSAVDTGITMDSLPYILVLGVVAAAAVVLFTKKRLARED